MGCFNAAGSMSNLTIRRGEKIALFLLVNKGTNSSSLITNDGECVMKTPYCPPIFGEYNDYGGIENIEKSQTTKDLEHFFGGTIEDICNFVTSYRVDFCVDLERSEYLHLSDEDFEELEQDRYDMLAGMCAMFEHSEIYHRMAAKFYNDGPFKFNDRTMNAFGFEYKGTEVNKEIEYSPDRYTQKYTKDIVTVYTDGSFMSNTIFIDGVKIKTNIYNKNHLEQYVNLPWDFSYEKQEITYLLEQQKISNEIGVISDKLNTPEGSDNKELLHHLTELIALSSTNIPNRNLITQFNHEIGSIEEIITLNAFSRAMFSTNNFYYPAMSGEQHGNHDADLLLNNLRTSVLMKQMGRFEE